eukprot:CAMPEP_0115292538 /NCGR_PEP_ID=MMETSP0270-20121206/65187_1 /TAXON_ID=71861 /ORGANISM="Scrippsiella trochoidea, Strain CCMP3099" /LENGTH=374 /DNA_ID=CAMNT_0002709973 /DNA_START=18 /DNA_END=1142 /DNA_ORIENTATION=+
MGQVLSFDCFDWLMPSAEKARTIYYGNAKEKAVHLQPAPPGSLLVIGHITLEVPRATPTQIFYGYGFGLPRAASKYRNELRFSAGPTQLRFHVMSEETDDKVKPSVESDIGLDGEKGYLTLRGNLKRPDPFFSEGEDPQDNEERLGDYTQAQQWPGNFSLWVDDVRCPYDTFSSVRRQFTRDLTVDTFEPHFAGEQGLEIRDPWAKNRFSVEEAPPHLSDALRSCGPKPALGQTFNTLAVINVQYVVKAATAIAAISKFYSTYLQAATDETPSSCTVHFSPVKDFHQTLTFVHDEAQPPSSGPGVICMYTRTEEQFSKAFKACSGKPGFSGTSVAHGEFKLGFCFDPASGQAVAPLKHVIRSPTHPECPVQPLE